jgi:hypothetical protein
MALDGSRGQIEPLADLDVAEREIFPSGQSSLTPHAHEA